MATYMQADERGGQSQIRLYQRDVALFYIPFEAQRLFISSAIFVSSNPMFAVYGSECLNDKRLSYVRTVPWNKEVIWNGRIQTVALS